MAKTFTMDSNSLITRDIIVRGEVHISGKLDIMDEPTIKYAEKKVDDSAGTITVIGDLYIQSDEVLVKEAIAYYDMNLRRDETFDQKTTNSNSVVVSTGRMLICGNIKSERDITYYSTEVHDKVKRAKLNKIITNIKK